MRLAQLARKLSVKPVEIQGFLAERGYTLEFNPNTRLTDDHVLLAVRHFNPAMEASILQDQSPTEIPEPTTVEVEPAPIDEENAEPSLEQIEPSADAAAEYNPESEPEVIRAPKTELPGLRVIGKIELKEAKKKETPPPSSEEADQSPQSPERKTPPPRREKPPQRTWKNPLEVQRQREAQQRQEKREKEIELEKQRRTQKYLKKVKSVPTKPVRRTEENEVEVQEDIRPVPKTWLGKIARWLTT